MAKTKDYKKGFREGYNNPSHFDQDALLKSNSDAAKGAIDGICQRYKDNTADNVTFKK